MPSIVVLGGGTCGLVAAMLLARDGHDVTVLEADPAPVPDTPAEAWDAWDRAGVTQFRQAHYVQARARQVLEAGLPDVRAALAAHALEVDPTRRPPPGVADRGPQPGDERLRTLTARRTTVEQVIGRAAQDEPRVDVRRGVAVAGLMADTGGRVPHVTGVRTRDGDVVPADLVIDAMGRRSQLPAWLVAAGAEPMHEEAEENGFLYYTRFFRARDGARLPEVRAPLLTPMGTFSLLTLPADDHVWSVTVFVSAGDRPLKAVRHVDPWTALVRSCPHHAHWTDGEPLGGIDPMGGVLDRYRRMVVDDRPVATGVLPVADACACTNPSFGRGIALGLAHAELLPGVVREHLAGEPDALVTAWDAATESELAPWYRATVAVDRGRLAEIEALRRGTPVPAADLPAQLGAALMVAMGMDGEVFRAGMEIIGCLSLPRDVLRRPGLAERVLQLAGAAPPPPRFGPSRAEALALVG